MSDNINENKMTRLTDEFRLAFLDDKDVNDGDPQLNYRMSESDNSLKICGRYPLFTYKS